MDYGVKGKKRRTLTYEYAGVIMDVMGNKM